MSKEYFVAEGKSIVTAVGIKGPGAKITEKDFSSPEVFKNFIENQKDSVVEKEPASKADVRKSNVTEPMLKEDKKAKKEEKEPEPVKEDEEDKEGKDSGASKK